MFQTSATWRKKSQLLLVLLISSNCSADLLKLTIFHNNDMHARFEETSRTSAICQPLDKNCVGGFARTAHVIREARREAEKGTGPNVLYLNAGDTFVGTTWFFIHGWKIAADFLNILMPDAMSFGNHEFDMGTAGITPLLDAIKFPVVAANIDFSKDPELSKRNISKSVTLTVDGHKIGVIGYLTPETEILSSPENIEFEDEVIALNEECKKLTSEGVNIIIALGHSGLKTDIRIAEEVECVDIVIGGHDNTFLWNGKQPDEEIPYGPYPLNITQNSGRIVPVVQAYAYTKYLGKLNVIFHEDGEVMHFHGQPILLDKSIPQDQDVLDLLDKYRPEVDAQFRKVVGKTRVVIEGGDKVCRYGECNFGNLITDCFVDYRMSVYRGPLWTDATIGLIQGGNIRNTLNATLTDGNVTMGELNPCIPFMNKVVSMKLLGSDLIKTLELGVRSNGETSRGEFLQVSGLKVVYDMSKPTGSRVVSAKALCNECEIPRYEPVEANRTYGLMTAGFLSRGGDGHYVLEENSFDKVIQDLNDIEILEWCIRKRTPIYPVLEERIQFVGSSDVVREFFSLVAVLNFVLMYFR